MADIATLVTDISNVVGKVDRGIDLSRFSSNITSHYLKQMGEQEERVRQENTLYFSEVGDPCLRRVWYKVHQPEKAEVLPASTRVKFMYGDILEDVVLQLARDAGHDVSDEQRVVEIDLKGTGWKVRGRIDAIIDGVVTDVKSVTKYSEEKFKHGLVDDPFGYKLQLGGYAAGLGMDTAGFLTIQKELGHINYYPLAVDKQHSIEQMHHTVEAVELPEVTSLPRMPDVPQSATSKNKKLCTTCSYCGYKKDCWPGLRTFIYSNGPVFLTEVVDVPRVPEATGEDATNDE